MAPLIPKRLPARAGVALRSAQSYLLGGIAALFAGPVWANACDGLTPYQDTQVPAVAAAVARQLHVNRVNIRQAYRSDDWSLLYVVTDEMDQTFLLYSDDPLTSRYLTLWGGVPEDYTEEQILDWTHSNAPGIPEPLAQCLAWAARQDRTP
ncbi:MAG: hypothetical protein JWR16_1851 [Nevskia sp.]|nr:hypothetical protein [Nevskia sp.]